MTARRRLPNRRALLRDPQGRASTPLGIALDRIAELEGQR
jgi:hypothetical protein